MKKEGYRRKTTIFEKKTPGLTRVMGRPARSSGFGQVVAPVSLLINLNWSNHRVN
jgi:hypothetical protein